MAELVFDLFDSSLKVLWACCLGPALHALLLLRGLIHDYFYL
jgi:hypothetical protein